MAFGQPRWGSLPGRTGSAPGRSISCAVAGCGRAALATSDSLELRAPRCLGYSVGGAFKTRMNGNLGRLRFSMGTEYWLDVSR